MKDGNESCDGSDLGGATCTSLGYTLDGPLRCTAGCGYDTSGCTSQAFPGTGQDADIQAGGSDANSAYTYNGDGTLTDNNTGLTWEILLDDGSIHDKNNKYTWGNAFAVKIQTLNGASFAGHTDWRVPNVKELVSIVSYVGYAPAVSPAFSNGLGAECPAGCTACWCTASGVYWSSTTWMQRLDHAWVVDFSSGDVDAPGKGDGYFVRAVRGG